MRTLPKVVCIFCTVLSTAAHATPCGPHDAVIGNLAKQFGETLQVQAMTDAGRMIEMTANPETGTWTAVATTPDGMTCLLDAGKRFKAVPPGEADVTNSAQSGIPRPRVSGIAAAAAERPLP